MANSKQANKRIRQNSTRRKRNLHTAKAYKTAVKNVMKAVEEGTLAKSTELLSLAYKAIANAAKKRILSKAKAARKQSQVAKAAYGLLGKVQIAAVTPAK
jgi:small subunit ribosomal protein S20